jgi:hypothetical protein
MIVFLFEQVYLLIRNAQKLKRQEQKQMMNYLKIIYVNYLI